MRLLQDRYSLRSHIRSTNQYMIIFVVLALPCTKTGISRWLPSSGLRFRNPKDYTLVRPYTNPPPSVILGLPQKPLPLEGTQRFSSCNSCRRRLELCHLVEAARWLGGHERHGGRGSMGFGAQKLDAFMWAPFGSLGKTNQIQSLVHFAWMLGL